MSRKRMLIVGLGNPLWGADGFGSAVVRRLADDPVVAARAELCEAGTDLLGRIGDFAAYDEVILIDALLDPEGEPSVRLFDEAAMADRAPAGADGVHALSPVDAIRVFRRLCPGAPTRFVWVTWGCRHLGPQAGACPPGGVSRGVEAVKKLIAGDQFWTV